MVTFTDEGTFLADGPKRRQQKVYRDVLGRTVKTEVFNWQGGSIYSATVNSYNVRDQVTQVRQFQGAAPDPDNLTCPSGTCQKTTVEYDGHGRLKTQHVPAQKIDPTNPASTDHTTWEYNADDTVQRITDARGASQTISYNDRHLVKGITYAVPPGSSIPVTPNVTYSYDAAGNRLTMSDGFGSSSNVYDLLSRMISESRTFNDPNNPTINGVVRSMGYTYNLGGQISSITDPFNATFNHGHDAAGRLVSVTGSAYAGVTTYVSSVKYRAWGAVESAAFGNTPTQAGQYNANETVEYNARLQPTEFRLTSTTFGFRSIRENYDYYPDGRLRTLTDLDDTSGTNPPATVRYLSRSFAYDHAGRFWSTNGLPAQQTYEYDVFGNLRGRSGSYYNQPSQSDSATYTDNRRAGWNYDASGQITSTPAAPNANARTLSHDAAGRLVQTVDTGASATTTYTVGYDGDGRILRESVQGPSSETTYSLGSTALGSTVTTVTSAGAKRFTHVPAGGLVLPRQTEFSPASANVAWMQQNPMGLTETAANGTQVQATYDVLGNYIPHQFMNDPRPPMGAYAGASPGMAWLMMDPSNYGMGCMVDSLPSNCTSAMRRVNNGSGFIYSVTGGAPMGLDGALFMSTMRKWVRDDGPLVKSPPDTPGIIYVDANDDGKGHWEFSEYFANTANTAFFLTTPPPCPGPIPDAIAKLILGIASKEHIDPTLLSVTMRHESSFGTDMKPNERWVQNKKTKKWTLVGWDVGPMQLATNIWFKSPFIDGLKDPVGDLSTNSQGEYYSFNGDFNENVTLAARAFRLDLLPRSKGKSELQRNADAAGMYRGPADYKGRYNQYLREAPGDALQFECLKKQ